MELLGRRGLLGQNVALHYTEHWEWNLCLSMASTPDTSFSSENDLSRRATKPRGRVAQFELPSPQRSDDSPDTSDDAVEQAFSVIFDVFRGLPAQEANPSFYLHDQHTYEKLYQRLASQKGLLEYFEDHIRKDWNADAGRLTLRLMAGPLHEVYKQRLDKAIDKQLDRIADNFGLWHLRDNIRSAGHAQVQERGQSSVPYFDRSPDGQFRYKDTRHPPFVFEVAYSQCDKSLQETVTEFFEQITGKVCTILAIDIEYADREERAMDPNHHHTARVSLLATEESQEPDTFNIRCLKNAQVFRNAEGHPLPGEISLPFTSFLPINERRKVPANLGAGAEVCLDFAHLSEMLGVAEQEQRTVDARSPDSSAPRCKRIRWLDEDGNITRETALSTRPKRQRTGSDAGHGASVPSPSDPTFAWVRTSRRMTR